MSFQAGFADILTTNVLGALTFHALRKKCDKVNQYIIDASAMQGATMSEQTWRLQHKLTKRLVIQVSGIKTTTSNFTTQTAILQLLFGVPILLIVGSISFELFSTSELKLMICELQASSIKMCSNFALRCLCNGNMFDGNPFNCSLFIVLVSDTYRLRYIILRQVKNVIALLIDTCSWFDIKKKQ